MTYPHHTPAFGITLTPTEEALEVAIGERDRLRGLLVEVLAWLDHPVTRAAFTAAKADGVEVSKEDSDLAADLWRRVRAAVQVRA